MGLRAPITVTRSTSISAAVITGFVGYAAHTYEGNVWLGSLLAPIYIACLYVVLGARVRNGLPNTLLGSAFLAGLTQTVIGLQCWSLMGYFIRAYALHVFFLGLAGVLFGAVVWRVTQQPDAAQRVLGFSLAWVVISVGGSGFQWGYPTFLSASLTPNPVLAQPLAFGGPWLLDGLIAFVGSCLGEGLLGVFALHPPGRRRWSIQTSLALPCWIALLVGISGYVRLASAPSSVSSPLPSDDSNAIPVSVIQGGVPGWYLKHAVGWESLRQVVTDVYADLTQSEGPWLNAQRSPWVILPESAIYEILPAGDDAWPSLAALLEPGSPGAHYMTTVTSLSDPNTGDIHTYEYRFLLGKADSKGTVHPFKESGKNILIPVLDGEFAPSQTESLIEIDGTRFGPLICWDAMFTHLTRELAQNGAELFVVTANVSRALKGDASTWHGRMARMRAIETGRPLIFASQAGPSFVADAEGRVVHHLPIGAQGSLRLWVTPTSRTTPYLYLGPWILPLCTCLLLFQAWRVPSRPLP